MAGVHKAKDDYILDRDYHSIVRLNHQHAIMKEEYGGLLHPDIPIDKGNLKIADIGTGTCIWAIELSHKLPSTAFIDAFDLSLAQCPPKSWLPANISLLAHDAFTPFPETMIGKYDVVHIQLFAVIVKNDDPAPLVRNLMSILKPGGYLQWNDLDINAQSLACTADCVHSTKPTMDMMALMSKPRNSSAFDWVGRLGDVFSQHGLESVRFERYDISDHNKMWWSLNCCMLCEEYCNGLEKETTGSNSNSKVKEHRRAVTEAAKAAQEGAVVSSSLVMAIGRKGDSLAHR